MLEYACGTLDICRGSVPWKLTPNYSSYVAIYTFKDAKISIEQTRRCSVFPLVLRLRAVPPKLCRPFVALLNVIRPDGGLDASENLEKVAYGQGWLFQLLRRHLLPRHCYCPLVLCATGRVPLGPIHVDLERAEYELLSLLRIIVILVTKWTRNEG